MKEHIQRREIFPHSHYSAMDVLYGCMKKAVIGYYLIDLETPTNSFVALISFYHIALQNVIHLLSIS